MLIDFIFPSFTILVTSTFLSIIKGYLIYFWPRTCLQALDWPWLFDRWRICRGESLELRPRSNQSSLLEPSKYFKLLIITSLLSNLVNPRRRYLIKEKGEGTRGFLSIYYDGYYWILMLETNVETIYTAIIKVFDNRRRMFQNEDDFRFRFSIKACK